MKVSNDGEKMEVGEREDNCENPRNCVSKVKKNDVSNLPGLQAGHTLVTDILAKIELRSIEPHNYQPEGICYALNGVDLVMTMDTGARKPGFYCFLMLIMLAIS